MITFTENTSSALAGALRRLDADRVMAVTDENVSSLVMARLDCNSSDLPVCVIAPGDENKTLATAGSVWDAMERCGLTRRSVIVNIGGGVVTDLGGFCAATFKRGIRFINVPTTLLGAVDAAVGGKTGVNRSGLKNEIGVFREADEVIVSTEFFDTLPPQELLSGYGEVIKHAMLTSEDALVATLDKAPAALSLEMLRSGIELKQSIVASDPRELGLRKALNLGHTVGHALESLSIEKGHPVPHGINVARGLVTETVLSHLREGFTSRLLHMLADYVRNHYGPASITCDDYDTLIGYMRHDKKNTAPGDISFTLLAAPGEVRIDRTATDDEITAALDISRDLLE